MAKNMSSGASTRNGLRRKRMWLRMTSSVAALALGATGLALGTATAHADVFGAHSPIVTATDTTEACYLTHGIELFGQGKTEAIQVLSDGDMSTHSELIVNSAGKPVANGTDLSGVTVALKDEAGNTVVDGAPDTWRGAANFPVVQNFGLHKFALGTYTVSVSEDVENWALVRNSYLRNGQSLEVTSKCPVNLFVALGYDSDNDNIADIDEGDDSNDAVYASAIVALNHTETVAKPTFDNPLSANVVESGGASAGTTFAATDATPAWVTVNEDGSLALAPTVDNAEVAMLNVPVSVTYPDDSTEIAFVAVNVIDLDPDRDGFETDVDECPATPQGAKVDGVGCSVAFSLGQLPDLEGVVDAPIGEVVVLVENPGMLADVQCVISGVDGLSAVYDADKGGCVIAGTPTSADVDGYTLTVQGVAQDSENKVAQFAGDAGTAIVFGDADRDGVTDDGDQHADIAAGAEADGNGHQGKPESPKPVAGHDDNGSGSGELPVTGANVAGLGLLAVSLMAVGGVALVTRRRKDA